MLIDFEKRQEEEIESAVKSVVDFFDNYGKVLNYWLIGCILVSIIIILFGK